MSPPMPPYSLGKSDDFFDTSELGPELTPPQVTSAPPGMPTPGLGELASASRTLSRPYRTDFDEAMLRDGYSPIIEELGLGQSQNPANFAGEFGPNSAPVPLPRYSSLLRDQGKSWLESWTHRETQEELIAGEIRRRKAAGDPRVKDLPDSVDGLHKYFLEQEKSKRRDASAIAAQGQGFMAGVAGLAGGVAGTFDDPANLVALLVPGGPAKNIATVAGRDALINGGLETLMLPSTKRHLQELGEDLTGHEAVMDVTMATVAGSVFGATTHTAGRFARPAGEAAGKAYDATVQTVFNAMPDSVQKRWAGKMKAGGVDLTDLFADVDNHELASFAEATIGADKMTPEEKAAATVLRGEQEAGDASPFQPGPDGDAAHSERLADAIRSILDGPRPATDLHTSTALTPPAPRAFVPSATVDEHFSAILGNEGGLGRHGEFLTSPKGAIGPAQVMPGTAPYAARLAGLPWDPVKYRSDRAYNEALGKAYYAEQLQTFGDPLKAAAAYNAGPGNAARGTGVRGAIARAERAGEPANWMAYLPAETEQYVRDFERRLGGDVGPVAAGGIDEDAAIAAARAAADDAERQGLELSEQLGRDTGGQRSRVEQDIVPELKRSLFDSDEAFADAQAALHASLNSEPSPQIGAQSAGNGPPERIPGVEAPKQPPIVEMRQQASAIESAASPVPEGHVRLWRGTRPSENALGLNYTTDLAGIALPFQRHYGGPLRYVDVPQADLGKYSMAGGAATGAEFHLPAEMAARSVQLPPTGPLTRAELEAMRPDMVNARRDALWLAAAHFADRAEPGDNLGTLWAARDKGTGEIVTWTVKKQKPESELYRNTYAEDVDVEKLTPEAVAIELRQRAADQAAIAAGAQVKIDDPALTAFDASGGPGRTAQAESLEHDLRMDASAATREGGAKVLQFPRRSANDLGINPEVASEQFHQVINDYADELGMAPDDLDRFYDTAADGDPIVVEIERRLRDIRGLPAFRPDHAADQPKFRLTEEGEEKPLGDILAELDRERDVLNILKDCLKPGGGAA